MCGTRRATAAASSTPTSSARACRRSSTRAGSFHKGQGLRIDLVYGTAPVLARTREVEIDRDYRKKQDGLIPSDHAPVWAELE